MIGDYNWQKEDFDYLNRLPEVPMHTEAWKAFSRPAEIDISWHRTENQGQIGSCQGHALSSVLERLAFVHGEHIQLSEIFAYLATQKIDGLLGSDSGSTIAGGCQLAVNTGCCLEEMTGYPTSYPSRSGINEVLKPANYQAAAKYKAKSAWKIPQDLDKTLDFIAGGGGISFGIRYYHSLIPADRVVRSFRPGWGSGGHAMCVLGYDRNGNLRAANSHADGPYLITPEAWQQMLQDNYTAAIGLMGNTEAEPINWYTNSPYYKLTEAPDAATGKH